MGTRTFCGRFSGCSFARVGAAMVGFGYDGCHSRVLRHSHDPKGALCHVALLFGKTVRNQGYFRWYFQAIIIFREETARKLLESVGGTLLLARFFVLLCSISYSMARIDELEKKEHKQFCIEDVPGRGCLLRFELRLPHLML